MTTLNAKTTSKNFPKHVVLWGHEVARLRNGEFSAVDYTENGETTLTGINPLAILDVIDTDQHGYHTYTTKTGKKGYYISIPKDLITFTISAPSKANIVPVIKTVTKSVYASPVDVIDSLTGVSYQIYNKNNGYIISKTLTKSFSTVDEAKKYIRNSLRVK